MGLSTLLLVGTALAVTPKDARATFERYVELNAAFDASLAELYAEDAVIRFERDGREMALSSAQLTAMFERGMKAAEEAGDVDTYRRVKVKRDGDGFKVTARRESASKCFTDEAFFLRLEERDGELLIVEQFTTSPGLSHCAPDPELAALLEQTRAGLVGHLPLMLDEETRLEKVEVQGSALVYHSRLVNVQSSEMDLERLRAHITPIALSDVCVGSGKVLSEAGATIRYALMTGDDVALAPIDVTPAACAMLVE